MVRASSSPLGRPTRGTTGTNRLRRVDRWIARHPALRRDEKPLVIDVGFGASVVTALELQARLARVHPHVRVHGLEIDPERVARAREQLDAVRACATPFAPDANVTVSRGGFEIPLSRGDAPVVIRAMNVLRQYDEGDVAAAWQRMARALAPEGILVEGTCDELGRVMTWVEVDHQAQPRSLSLSLRLAELELPSIAAERLPKVLIHRNVPGERIHDFFVDLDREWERSRAVAPFGPIQRWQATLAAMSPWPLRNRHRWRLGEVSVDWAAIAPRAR